MIRYPALETDAVIYTRDLARRGSKEGGAALRPGSGDESGCESWALTETTASYKNHEASMSYLITKELRSIQKENAS